MPRFVQLRTNEALSNRRHKSVLLKAAEQRLRPRLIAAAVAVLVQSMLSSKFCAAVGGVAACRSSCGVKGVKAFSSFATNLLR